MPTFADEFTLIIPTYNRPDRLSKLLAFLGRERLGCRVFVSDSSNANNLEANLSFIEKERAALDIRHVHFDPQVHVWEKFWRSSELVSTPFASLCADDDLVLPSALSEIVSRMQIDPTVAVGHGWYFSFLDDDKFSIPEIVYKGSSIQDRDPVRRMYALASRYEANSYGVYRTPVLRQTLCHLGQLKTLLMRELAGCNLAVIAGKANRYPILWHGRSISASESYSGWHPQEVLAESPQRLFEDYARYREIIVDAVIAISSEYSRSDALAAVDLAHLRYLSDYIRPVALDFIFSHLLEGTPIASVTKDLWSKITTTHDETQPRPQWVEQIRKTIPNVRQRVVQARTRDSDLTFSDTIAVGLKRDYSFKEKFLGSVAELGKPTIIASELAKQLNNYCA